MNELDTSILEFHYLPEQSVCVEWVEGQAFRVIDGEKHCECLVDGALISLGDTLVLGPQAQVLIGDISLHGGATGLAHSFVPQDAFKNGPGQAQVASILAELSAIARRLGDNEVDPIKAQISALSSPYDRAVATEFCWANLSLDVARRLSADTAREIAAVALFESDQTVFVAVASIDIYRLHSLVEMIDRPVNPHMVPEPVLEELLVRVYGENA